MTETPDRRTRAGHGDDSIYWDKSKNRYIGAVSLGYTPAGKRNRPKVSGRTKAEVRQKLRELRKELADGAKAPANYSVAQAVTDWISQGLKGREVTSVDTYKSLAEHHIIPHLGKAKMRDLEADDLDEWLEAEAEVLATQSLKMVHSILRRSISHAQRRGRAIRNVAELVEVPDGQAGRPSKSLSLKQGEAVLRAREGSWIHAYVVLSLLVGVRPEEARPLTWAHIHLAGSGRDKPHVDVWRSVRRHGDTKTRKSRRSLAMPRQAALVMKAHKRQEQARCLAGGKAWSDEALVFPTESGEVRSALNVRRNFRALLKEAGFQNPQEWTPRELRTSFVSLLSDHGIPIEVIARLVGHMGSGTTERVYRKQLRPVISEGAEAMDDIFGEDDAKDGGTPGGG
ncbi:site-specific integrase [Streptomyces fructofermentans]|uniref:Site-specific integrase n=1 Tax=Streptomyces fructofermentans TaxID=152141 RepID=A0A918K5A4_9ACTN|nr:site-specific integrase [Streptomyces fructofermentans]GGX50161.1 site-specific integrase [Streptomyces fructofermentans]